MTRLVGGLATVAAPLARLLSTARLELRLNIFSPAPWVIALVLAGFGAVAAKTAPDPTSFWLAWVLSAEIGPLTALLLLFLAAGMAHRPVRCEIAELLDSRLVGTEELFLGRWLGMLAALAVPLLLQVAATAGVQYFDRKLLPDPGSYGLALLRIGPAVVLLATLSFSLVVVTRVLILGAGLAGLAWMVFFFGQAFFPTAGRLELEQNAPQVWLGTAVVVILTLACHQRRRRKERSAVGRALGWGAALLCIATGVRVGWAELALPGRSKTVAGYRRLRDGDRRATDPTPNFAWVDLVGRRHSIAGMAGKPALLVFLGPRDNGLLPLLARMDALQDEFRGRGLRTLGVFLSRDLTAARDAGWMAKTRFPLVTDWGGPSSGEFDQDDPPSVAAWAFRIDGTPKPVLLLPDGRRSRRDLSLEPDRFEELRQHVRAVLEGEEEPPELPQTPTGLPLPLGR